VSTIKGAPGTDILSASTGGDFIDADAGNDQITLAFNSSADGGAGSYPVFSDTYLQKFESIHHFGLGPEIWDAGASTHCAARHQN
jgi:hypothetical protein